jgi:hypothetical protein
MRKNMAPSDPEGGANALLRPAVAAELTLLSEERKAEKRLAAALERLAQDEHRLRKAAKRLEQSREAVKVATDKLRDCQARRAAGPVLSAELTASR